MSKHDHEWFLGRRAATSSYIGFRGIVKRITILVILFILGLLASPIEAHHKFDHDTGKGPVGPILTVVEPVFSNAPFDISGSDFKKNSQVFVGIKFFCCLTSVTADKSKNFVFNHPGIAPGTYIAVAGFFKAGRFTVIESDPFTVN